jgi:hypothetical membrane protein
MQRPQFPLRLSRETLVGSVFWILSLEFFVGQAIAQLGWKGPPSYSLINDAISDLGVTTCGTVDIAGVPEYYCSKLYVVMNTSFVLTGAFILLGVYFTCAAWPWSRKFRAGIILVALAGIGKMAAGLNPPNVDFTLHSLGSLGIPIGDIGLILIGLVFRKKLRWLGYFSLLLGVAGFFGFLYFLLGNTQSGFWERVGSYPIILWCTLLGVYFIRRSQAPKELPLPVRE